MTHNQNKILILAGATASGKTALAIDIAKALPAVIINADAMQMVADLRILSARPSTAEEAQAEHALYGVLDAAIPTSVAVWLEMIVPIIQQAWAQGKMPMLVGGTGMYTSALMRGISDIPKTPESLRAQLRAEYPDAEDGRLHAALRARDPVMAAKLKPGDTQRLLRALEVVEATGKSLDIWQQNRIPLLPEATFQPFYLDRPRAEIYARIDRRFAQMLAQDALDEVQALMSRNLHPDTPILRACGVPELSAHLRGEANLADAIAKAQQHTRNYAKRQLTWIRNQLPEAIPVQNVAEVTAVLTT